MSDNGEKNRVDYMISRLVVFGVARPCHYQILITPPKKLLQDFPSISETLSVYCERGSLPGRSIVGNSVRADGPRRFHPYLSTYDQLPFTIRVSKKGVERRFFDAWMSMIYSQKHQKLGWYDDYATEVEIQQLDEDITPHGVDEDTPPEREPSLIYTLENAFPVAISGMELSYNSTDTYHTMNVTFTYDQWRLKDAPTIKPTRPLYRGGYSPSGGRRPNPNE